MYSFIFSILFATFDALIFVSDNICELRFRCFRKVIRLQLDLRADPAAADIDLFLCLRTFINSGHILFFHADGCAAAADIAGDGISINDFYDLHTTLQLQEKIIAKLDELDSQKKYIICKNKEEIEDFLNYTNKVICKSMKYAFFVANATKLGALKLQGNIISNNIEYVISKSEFLNGGCSIFICSCGLENGVCLWRGEYDSRVYFWQ